jgi:hypothetical protein
LIHNYLEAVESVVKRLFEARADYHVIINDLFKDSMPPIFVHNRNNPKECSGQLILATVLES